MTNKNVKVTVYKKSKKPKLGSGARFEKLTGELEKKGAKKPKALAASIGRKKYGTEKMTTMAVKGRKRKSKS
jgi:hypothetical protein